MAELRQQPEQLGGLLLSGAARNRLASASGLPSKTAGTTAAGSSSRSLVCWIFRFDWGCGSNSGSSAGAASGGSVTEVASAGAAPASSAGASATAASSVAAGTAAAQPASSAGASGEHQAAASAAASSSRVEQCFLRQRLGRSLLCGFSSRSLAQRRPQRSRSFV